MLWGFFSWAHFSTAESFSGSPCPRNVLPVGLFLCTLLITHGQKMYLWWFLLDTKWPLRFWSPCANFLLLPMDSSLTKRDRGDNPADPWRVTNLDANPGSGFYILGEKTVALRTRTALKGMLIKWQVQYNAWKVPTVESPPGEWSPLAKSEGYTCRILQQLVLVHAV